MMSNSDFLLEQYYETFFSEGQIDVSCSGIEPYAQNDLQELCLSMNIEMAKVLLDYSASSGQTIIREKISALYHHAVFPNNVVVTNGALEALSLLVFCLGKLHGNIVVCEPFFAPLSMLSSKHNIVIRHVVTYDETKFRINALFNAINSDTRAIILNNPNNPLGFSICEDELKEILQYAKQIGALVISDEVGLLLNNDQNHIRSIVEMSNEAISIGSMSKVFGVPGLRVGWLIIPNDVMRLSVVALKQQLSGSTSIISQQIASCILSDARYIIRKHMGIVEKNKEKLRAFLVRTPEFKCEIPIYGCSCMLEFSHANNVTRLAETLRKKHNLFVTPGEVFGLGNSLRLGLGLRTKDLNLFFESLRAICE